ncbi:MAG TPA: HAMP domain-containing sensor histidine kinase [Gaiellaceae bacterium]|nr:HAMP domain-containing sensor histidine kinase [Gaiellaceae bacterium]
MFHSLRFRLPAFFLAGVALAGIVSTAIAVQLFQDHVRSQSVEELKREASGLAKLYQQAALKSIDEGRSAPDFAAQELERATAARLYYVGAPVFFRQSSGLRELNRSEVEDEWQTLVDGTRVVTFEFTPPGEHKRFLAVGQPLELNGQNFGALVVAKKKTELTQGWFSLFELLLVALGVGLVAAGALAFYLSRRLAKPVLSLSQAADRIARGKYDVAVPPVRGGGEVSELAERFRQMASRLAEAEEQERNFLMSVSHELRTPLTAIRGHVEALREGVADDPEVRAESLAVIATEADRLERLVGDVLDLAKLDAHRFTVLREEVDMRSLVEGVYAAFGEEARRRDIDYRCETGASPVIFSDGDRVFQIVSNLLANAFRWTPDGGRVELALASSNGNVSVSVADTGPGIKAAEQERIFRPFWSRDGGGTGLGLAIARELALALGGRIELTSEPGSGSRFDLLLPTTLPR